VDRGWLILERVYAVILAGGYGDRLGILAQERAKPAVPFAGKYRIIDFSLSNCVNSGIYNVAVLAQYEPRSLVEHIGNGEPWELNLPGREIQLLRPYLTRRRRDWYRGTADAVYQNLPHIDEQGAEMVLILSGDHVYGMDYTDMLKFHDEIQADATLAVTRVPEEETHRFGTVIVDEEGQVTGFHEKVKKPKSNFVSMGVYLFNKDFLRKRLEEDARSGASKHDFGRNVIPRMIGKDRIFAYVFDGYWRDVGTVQAYWQANAEILDMSPSPLFNVDWPICTKIEQRPPAIFSNMANVVGSLLSDGCVIEGRVEHSILSPGVMVAEGAVVKDSIIMSDGIIGPHSTIDCAVLDKEVVVEAGCHIGFGIDFRANRMDPSILNSGITIIGKKARIPPGVKLGRNCVVCCGVVESDFLGSEVQSGETVEPKRHPAR